MLDCNDGFGPVEDERGSTTRVIEFSLGEMRFPSEKGHWRVWSEASGKIKIEGRYIASRKTVVTIRKGDGMDASVPIHQLAGPLRRLLAKPPITADINKLDGAVPVGVSDELEVEYMMVGRELLAVAMAGSYGKPESVLVGVATVPHREAINLLKKVDTSKLKMLERGSKILVDTSSDARLVNGLKQAVQANGCIEDPSSDIIFSGPAKLANRKCGPIRQQVSGAAILVERAKKLIPSNRGSKQLQSAARPIRLGHYRWRRSVVGAYQR